MRGIDDSAGRLVSEVTGEIELKGNVLVIKRTHAHYKLHALEEQRETIERILGLHQERCPLARSLRGAIEISTSYELAD